MRRVFTTRPDTTVPPTTVSTTAQAVPPKLTVKKFINGRDDHALVTAGEDMTITYRVSNEGSMRIDDIRLTDAVKEGNAALQQAIDAQLGKVAPFALAPGESRDVEVTVTAPPDDASSDSAQLAILKEIKGSDGKWRDAESEQDAAPVKPGDDMQLRYTVTNTGSVELAGVDVVDKVTRLDEGDAAAFTNEINAALAEVGRNLSLEPGESKTITVTVKAPEGYHVNEAIATAPPVVTEETVVSSVPGTTGPSTTNPGSLTTFATTVTVTPNTPTNKAQSTPTSEVPPVTTTITPKPVTTTQVVTTTEKPDVVTTTRTTPVTTVQTVTPEPQTFVTTVTLPASTVTEVPVTTTTTQLPPKDDVLGKCVANAVRSPILYMVPLLAIGNMFGEVAAPYVKAINDQFNEISAEIQDEIRRKTPSYDFGIHGGHDNEQAAELRATVDAANRMLQELASRPDVQEYGKWAAIAMGVVVAGSRHPQQRLVHHRPPWRRPGAGVGVRVGVGCSVRHGDHLRDDDGPARHGDPGSW